MWKKLRRQVSKIFFKEEKIEENLPTDNSQDENIQKTYRARNHETEANVYHVSHVTYQYPKDRSFRFPVIPDEEKNVQRERKRRTPKLKQGANRGTPNYKQNQLHDVPAFMRRKETPRRKVSFEKVEEKKPVEQENVHPVVEQKIESLEDHTRPEELDRVFQKMKKESEGENGAFFTEDVSMNENLIFEVEDEGITSLGEDVAPAPVDEEDFPIESTLETSKSIETEEISNWNDEQLETKKMTEVEEASYPLVDEIDTDSIEVSSQVENVRSTYKEVPDYLLNDPSNDNDEDEDWVIEQQILLEQTLEHFKIDAKVVNITQGPAVTRFEIQPALGVKVSRIRNLADDFKLNMAAKDIRIEAPIPGKNTIGIEVPNRTPKIVTLQQLIETSVFKEKMSPLTIALGLTIEGKPLITDIGNMPHGLIAGATGSGKSVCVNTILLSLLYKANYDEVKFLLIDPKMVELAPYNGIPHLISPVITDVKAATMALKWAVKEMEQRYEQFAEMKVRNITKFNEKMVQQNREKEKMPYIVIVIDELADLMMMAPQDVEDAICRIAQKARACGIHLLIATQRPSVDVITGLIKANIPTRIAFSVSSQVDSRTMLDQVGAEKLLGKGDMLFAENGSGKAVRLQGPFVSDEEVDRVTAYMRTVAEPNYLFEQEQLLVDVEEEAEDELLHEVIHFVVSQNQASTSLLQRRFRIGYNRAARLIDTLERKGIVSEQNGSKPREVLITTSQLEQ